MTVRRQHSRGQGETLFIINAVTGEIGKVNKENWEGNTIYLNGLDSGGRKLVCLL